MKINDSHDTGNSGSKGNGNYTTPSQFDQVIIINVHHIYTQS